MGQNEAEMASNNFFDPGAKLKWFVDNGFGNDKYLCCWFDF